MMRAIDEQKGMQQTGKPSAPDKKVEPPTRVEYKEPTDDESDGGEL
jgi:hypothetical protein